MSERPQLRIAQRPPRIRESPDLWNLPPAGEPWEVRGLELIAKARRQVLATAPDVWDELEQLSWLEDFVRGCQRARHKEIFRETSTPVVVLRRHRSE